MNFHSFTPPETFWFPLVAGAVAAIAVAAINTATTQAHAHATHSKNHRGPKVRANKWAWWSGDVFTASTWSFKDSWATNITAIGGAVGVVTGSTNPLQGLAPSLPTYPFVILGLLFGGTVALAPLIYAALARDPSPEGNNVVHGSVGGLLLSSTVTLFATFGELAAIAVFIDASTVTTGERWLLIGALSAAAFFIALYAVRSFRSLVTIAQAEAGGAPSLMNASGVSATL